jgi:hypothetical protein
MKIKLDGWREFWGTTSPSITAKVFPQPGDIQAKSRIIIVMGRSHGVGRNAILRVQRVFNFTEVFPP